MLLKNCNCTKLVNLITKYTCLSHHTALSIAKGESPNYQTVQSLAEGLELTGPKLSAFYNQIGNYHG